MVKELSLRIIEITIVSLCRLFLMSFHKFHKYDLFFSFIQFATMGYPGYSTVKIASIRECVINILLLNIIEDIIIDSI